MLIVPGSAAAARRQDVRGHQQKVAPAKGETLRVLFQKGNVYEAL